MNAERFLSIIKPPESDSPFKLGSISSTYTTGRPKVLIDGELTDSARTYPCLSSYSPSADDRVVLAFIGHVLTVIGKIDSGASPWITPTLLNGWVNYGSGLETAAFMKDSAGFVHVKGMIKSGATGNGTIIFNLPIGYRPLLNQYYAVTSFGSFGSIFVSSGGFLAVNIANSGDLGISIIFKAEQ